jgi:UDP-N-acetyl-D-mannosaminuronic acid dehydrogenase
MININQICVVGLGYVGLPLAALLTKNNIKVLGVDTNTKVVNNLNKNKIILEEQKLEKIIKKAISKKLLKASLTPEQSCIFILAVPTPIDKQLKPNISYLLKAAKSIAPFLKKGNLIIIESTIPAGTTLKILMLLKTLRKDLIFPNNKNKKKKYIHCILSRTNIAWKYFKRID